MEAACAPNLIELLAQAPHPGTDHSPVGLDLRFARTAKKTESTALPFQVSPTADKATLLIIEMSEFHLQTAFRRCRALAKNFKNQAGAIDNLALQPLFEIALLNGGQRTIDNNQFGFILEAGRFDPFDLTFTEQGAGPDFAHRNDKAFRDFDTDRQRKATGFLQTRFRIDAIGPAPDIRACDKGTRTARDLTHQIIGEAQASASSSESPVRSTCVAG